ncbi:hypothetical protein H310_05111 [Aphanomyces invadans]|uniref:Uncharacterized protein n=1 Tax=Aphanomyces invadans TaxID=157072 RepID=A0A024UCX7_9STRA|nr:hypothetical protein H310_05111 [Aphanomyces invadans]ETW03742.1 hypothetical protein H310_05111 [Aphanomyces invadans]|eukprot:XP_008867971.1 hypothetical protein H310_05111 [Aphanomyces invadans]
MVHRSSTTSWTWGSFLFLNTRNANDPSWNACCSEPTWTGLTSRDVVAAALCNVSFDEVLPSSLASKQHRCMRDQSPYQPLYSSTHVGKAAHPRGSHAPAISRRREIDR